MRRLLALLFASLAQQAAALAATPSVELLASHESGRRTPSRHDRSATAAADVSVLGSVELHGQVPWPEGDAITRFSERAVFGTLMLLTINPPRFVSSAAVQSAVQDAVARVAAKPDREVPPLSVTDASVSLTLPEDFPGAVQVNFRVSFATPKDRQTFIWTVASNNGRKIAAQISDLVPAPYTGKCKLPYTDSLSLLGESESTASQVATTTAPPELMAFGNITLDDVQDPLAIASSTEWQEALAMAISEVAWVSRLQVGTMMAVQSQQAVSVDFWLTSRSPRFRKAAIDRVLLRRDRIYNRTRDYVAGWAWSSNTSMLHIAYGCISLQVPNPPLFASSHGVREAVDAAVAQVAVLPSPQALKLSVLASNATVSVVETATGIVKVNFQVQFRTMKDRQMFAWNFAMDGAEKLASTLDALVPEPFAGHCRLLGDRRNWAQMHHNRGRAFRHLWFLAGSLSLVAQDPHLQEAAARVISEMASVPQQQVGVLVIPGRVHCGVYYWVTSADVTIRQDAMWRTRTATTAEIVRRILLQLDKLHAHPQSRDSAELVSGSVALQVAEPELFRNNSVVTRVLRVAIARLAAVPVLQVNRVIVRANLWRDFPQVVRVGFLVNFSTGSARQAFASKMALDGGEKLLKDMSEQLPEPFKGTCRLPQADHTQASSSTVARNASQPYGTIRLSVFTADRLLNLETQLAVSKAIATVASVASPQVGMLVTVQSSYLVNVDFWVASVDATLRQAATQRVDTGWTNLNLPGFLSQAFGSQPFTACGGSVACCAAPSGPYLC